MYSEEFLSLYSMKECVKEQSLYEAFLNATREYPNEVALQFFHFKLSYNELLYKVNQFAQGLKELGLVQGDVISLVLPNIPEAVYLLYGANQLGIIVNPLHPKLPLNEIVHSIKLTKTKFIFCLNQRYAELNKQFHNVFSINPFHERSVWHEIIGHKAHNKLIHSFYKKEPLRAYVHLSHEDAVYLNSGGTTGIPKIVRLSSYAFNASAANYEWIVGTQKRSEIKILAVLPMFHGFGLTVGIHYALACGSRTVLFPKFNRKLTAKYVKKGDISVLIGIPILFKKLLVEKEFNGTKLQNLKFAFVGGDFVTQKLQQDFDQRMEENGSKCRLQPGYGLTETLSIFSVNNYKYSKNGTVGLPFPNMDCLIVDEKMNPLPKGNEGQLLVSGEVLMNGYIGEKEEFATINGKRYLCTGDIMKMNDDGALIYRQREKRVVKVSGIPVFPTEVEDQLMSLDFIYDCAAIGVKDEKHDHILKLFVVVQRNNKLPQEEVEKRIRQCILENVGIYALPKEIVYIRQIPKTLVGKIDVKLLSKEE